MGHHESPQRLEEGVSRTRYLNTRLLLLLASSTFNLQSLSLTKTDPKVLWHLASSPLKTGLPGPNCHEQEVMQREGADSSKSHSKSVKRLEFKAICNLVSFSSHWVAKKSQIEKMKGKNKNSPPASRCPGAQTQTPETSTRELFQANPGYMRPCFKINK